MTEPTPKKKNMSGPIDEFTLAARVCRILEAQVTDDVELEKEILDARAKKRVARQNEINGLFARCPEDRRQHAGKLILTRGLSLCGFELAALVVNDSATPEGSREGELPGAATDWLNEQPKGTTKPIVIDRDRKTGATRT